MNGNIIEKVKLLAVEVFDIAGGRTDMSIEKKGSRDFVTTVDKEISRFLCERLPEILPGSIVISEEGYQGRPGDHRFSWIIDPVDGTTNYIYGHPDYATSIGLLDGAEPVLGVIYAPAKQEMYYAESGEGAYRNGMRIHVRDDSAIGHTLVLAETDPYNDRSKNRFVQEFNEIYRDCIDYRITGSAAIDCCYVASGRAGAFIGENLKPWDLAAGDIIVREAGGIITDWCGKAQPFYGSSTVLATNCAMHSEFLARLSKFV